MKTKRTLALALAAAMLLSLAACSKPGPEPTGPDNTLPVSEYAYQSAFTQVGESSENSYNPLLYTQEGVYASRYEMIGTQEPSEGGLPADAVPAMEDGTAPEDETPEDETAPEDEAAPEEDASGLSSAVPEDPSNILDRAETEPVYSDRYYFIGLDGTVTPLENYVPSTVENTEGYADFSSSSSLSGLALGEDGNLLALENVYVSYFNGPEGMTEESEEYWNYRVYFNKYYIRVLAPDMSEISSAQIDTGIEDAYFYTFQPDGQGNILAPYDTEILAVSPDGKLAYRVDTGENYVENLFLLGDGRICAMAWGEESEVLLTLDPQTHTLSEPVPFSGNLWNMAPGNGEYDFFYSNSTRLMGYDIETQRAEPLLDWVNCDINGVNVNGFRVMDDGTVLSLIGTWDNSYETISTELVTLSRVPADSLPQRQKLTLAMLWYDSRLANEVIRFNRGSDSYRIEVVDYSQYNTDDDYEAGLTKLTAEIAAGNTPDILVTDNLPYAQWAARGIFADLYPLLDADPDYSREDFFPSVLTALEVGGGLYQIAPSFYVNTVIGARSVVGDTPGWTYAEFDAALNSMPEGCNPFDASVTKSDMLYSCLLMSLDSFIDWSTGQCRFDSEEFINLLEFANRFPASFDWDNYVYEDVVDLIAQGRQMLMSAYIYSLNDILYNDYYFGGAENCTYIGYPTGSGTGSSLGLNTGYAIGSRCAYKEAAWSFIRRFLAEDYQMNAYGLPSNRHAFDKQAEELMKPHYQTQDGVQVLDENGEPIREPIDYIYLPTGEQYPIYELSQLQADKLLELIDGTDRLADYNQSVLEMITKRVEPYFSGQQSAQTVADSIQSAMFLYINEQR